MYTHDFELGFWGGIEFGDWGSCYWEDVLRSINPLLPMDETISSLNEYCKGCITRNTLSRKHFRIETRHKNSSVNYEKFKNWVCFASKMIKSYFYSDVGKIILKNVCELLIYAFRSRCQSHLLKSLEKLVIEPHNLDKMRVGELKRLHCWRTDRNLIICDWNAKKEDIYREAIRKDIERQRGTLWEYYENLILTTCTFEGFA